MLNKVSLYYSGNDAGRWYGISECCVQASDVIIETGSGSYLIVYH